jgi:hypothetical protein
MYPNEFKISIGIRNVADKPDRKFFWNQQGTLSENTNKEEIHFISCGIVIYRI